MQLQNPEVSQILTKLDQIQFEISSLKTQIGYNHDEWEIIEEPLTEEDKKIIERNKKTPISKYISHEEVKRKFLEIGI